MNLINWTPRRHMLPMVSDWDHVINDFFGHQVDNTNLTNWSPAIDITEDNDTFIVTADLPGLSKKDISINIKDNLLTISGERKVVKNENDDRNYYRTERRYGSFKRSFQMTDQIIADKISASFKDGVLTVNVPKAEEVKPKEIDIKVA